MRDTCPAGSRLGALLVVLGTALGGCGGSGPTDSAGAVFRVVINVPQDTLTPRQVIELGTTLTDQQGRHLTGRKVTWQSSAPGILLVDSLGVARAEFDGKATVTATSEGITGQHVIVVRTIVRSITIAPPPDTIAAGESTTLTAVVVDTSGQPVSGLPVTWTTLTPQTATVVLVPVSAGQVTAVAAGTATIQARVSGATGSVTFPVIASPLLSGTWLLIDSITFTGSIETCRDSTLALLSQTGRSFIGDLQSTGFCVDGPAFQAYGFGQLHPLTVGKVRGAAISFLQANCLYTGTFLTPAEDSAAGTADCGSAAQVTHWRMVRRDPAAVLLDPVTEVAAGELNTCALTSTLHAYCWGYGPTGDGYYPAGFPLPSVVSGAGYAALGVSGHVCLTGPALATRCFGANVHGELGAGAIPYAGTPAPLSSGASFSGVVNGSYYSCGFTPGQAAFCWGTNDAGQLGTGTPIAESADPLPVAAPASFKAMAAGEATTCGLDNAGAAWCWGLNAVGELGDSLPSGFSLAPHPVLGNHVFAALAGDGHAMCGLDTGGSAWCWGDNTSGRLGDGTTTNQPVPVAGAPGLLFTRLAMGGDFTCGLLASGAAYCWGGNADGQLGNGTTTASLTPVPVAGNHSFRRLAAGLGHACGATAAGKLYCWGRNFSGQLGDGTVRSRSAPVLVQRQ